MRAPVAIVIAVLFSGSIAVPAAPNDETLPTMSFEQFPLPIKRSYFFATPGTPVGKAKQMDGPGPDDFPPCSEVYLEDERRYPSTEKGPVYMILARNVVRIYNISAVKTAPYKTIQPHIQELQQLLRKRPKEVPSGELKHGKYAKYEELPDYPPRNAAHMMQIKMQYLDTTWGSGLFYVTQFVQGIGEWPDNERLVYLFQGLSKDQKYYVAADFRVTHPALENAKADGEREANELTERLSQKLSKDTDDAFTPSLKKIREWMSTLKIE